MYVAITSLYNKLNQSFTNLDRQRAVKFQVLPGHAPTGPPPGPKLDAAHVRPTSSNAGTGKQHIIYVHVLYPHNS